MSASPTRELFFAAAAAPRLTRLRGGIGALAPATQALLVAPTQEAADDLLRALAFERGAWLGIHRLTINRLAGLLAAEELALAGLAPASGMALEAIAARSVYRLTGSRAIDYLLPVADRPGFAAALAETVEELRLNNVGVEALAALGENGRALSALLLQFEAELEQARLIDRAAILEIAVRVARRDPPPRFVGIPTFFLDVAIESAREAELFAAVSGRAPSMLATLPAGDAVSRRMAEAAINWTRIIEHPRESEQANSLARVTDFLFSEDSPRERELDETVALVSAPGEMQECVEIARRIHREARAGVPFDRMAVLVHGPARYVALLQEVFARAKIPAYFAAGTRRPEPGGRALLTLLACAAEKLSARRFAEYLSLAQVPDEKTAEAAAGEAMAPSELAASALGADLELAPIAGESDGDLDPAAVALEGAVRAPWRWERLVVEAAVIGHPDRWRRRLDGLSRMLERQRAELADDDARVAALERKLGDLRHLKSAALPLIERLGALPAAASWGEWLGHLRGLARAAVRDADPVLEALAELEPMAPVGPVGLDEVRIVLAHRLGRLERRANRRRYGAVFVGSAARARGMAFEVVMVPGLAERVFPRRLSEDPLLPDSARERLASGLATQHRRAGGERLALQLAVGAARKSVMVSYPRLDLDQGRPRVPSFYALEVLRAAEGRLPGFDELARRAAGEPRARRGWYAPSDAEAAIDEAEFDIAVLDRLLDRDPAQTAGAAHYLLGANPHLARALRARARRWLRRWTPADGLVDPAPEELAALGRHQFSARSYSPTALQNFAACPYRFLLQAVHRLAPREEVEAIEAIDPLTRGSLFHEVQFELLTALRADGALPVTEDSLVRALAMVDRKLDEVAERWREELAPAIERVWRDGIDAIRADLREWLRRAAADRRWRPERFELAFGLSDRKQADPASTSEAVALAGGLNLRGSIDLVERGESGMLRATDHKTGRAWAPRAVVIGGGKVLQPVLYALAAERLLGEPVESGRLYYCTASGGYEERVVPLEEKSRAMALELETIVSGALGEGFMPAAPGKDECRRCDYRLVCGPYEPQRVKIKPVRRLVELTRLRGLP